MEAAAPIHRRPTLYLASWAAVAVAAALFIALVGQPADRITLAEAAANVVMGVLGQGLLLAVSVGVFAAVTARFTSHVIRLAAVPLGLFLGVLAQAAFVSMFASEALRSVLVLILAPLLQPFWVAVLMSVLGFWVPYLVAIGCAVLSSRKSVIAPVGIALVGLVAGTLVETLLIGWPLAPW